MKGFVDGGGCALVEVALRTTAHSSARNVTVWPRAIPQYNLGHTARLATIEKLRANFPGLYIVGNFLNGPAIGTCMEHALKVANEIRVSFAN